MSWSSGFFVIAKNAPQCHPHATQPSWHRPLSPKHSCGVNKGGRRGGREGGMGGVCALGWVFCRMVVGTPVRSVVSIILPEGCVLCQATCQASSCVMLPEASMTHSPHHSSRPPLLMNTSVRGSVLNGLCCRVWLLGGEVQMKPRSPSEKGNDMHRTPASVSNCACAFRTATSRSRNLEGEAHVSSRRRYPRWPHA